MDDDTSWREYLDPDRWHPAADIFPLLEGDELQELADNVAEHGLADPIVLHEGKVLDGRNRLLAADKAGEELALREDFEEWGGECDDPFLFAAARNAIGRQPTKSQLACVAVLALERYEEQARQRQGARTDLDRDLRTELHEGGGRAIDHAARDFGVSATYINDARRIRREDEDLFARVWRGELSIGKAKAELKSRRVEEQRARDRTRVAESAADLPLRVQHGDFRESLADLRDVDAVFTHLPDPEPELLADLAAWADRVLRPDGILAVLLPQSHLPMAYDALEGGRPYQWMASCSWSGGRGEVDSHWDTRWRPMLLYGGERRLVDEIRPPSREVQRRDWSDDPLSAQDRAIAEAGWYGAIRMAVEALTREGETVVDPVLASGGSTLIAARELGRGAVGADADSGVVGMVAELLGVSVEVSS